MDYGYRRDGFPTCPICTEDELFSHAIFAWARKGGRDEDRPTMTALFQMPFGCYRCGWEGTIPVAPTLAGMVQLGL